MSESLFAFARHWQIETWRIALWAGFVPVHWGIGIEIDAATRTAGIGLGPFYVGVGVIA